MLIPYILPPPSRLRRRRRRKVRLGRIYARTGACFAFKLVAVIGTALSIGVIGTSICRIVEAILNRDNILQSTLTFVIVIPVTLAIMLYMLILWGSANEIEKETDRNYIVSVFSSIVSFAALIVALVALYKS